MISNGQNNSSKPPLYGLVLAGGKSLRMGIDKGVMQWHDKEQRCHVADMLGDFCEEVFISCREEQRNEIDKHYQTLVDNYEGAGPAVGILSAFNFKADVAWLVIACDLPLLDKQTIDYLVRNRETASIGTTFKSPFDGLPEPLITIWEPASFEVLKTHISDGYSCPRKALIRNEARVNILIAPDDNSLMNANTPEDAEKVKIIIRSLQH